VIGMQERASVSETGKDRAGERLTESDRKNTHGA
jgi:hypothetical protein